MTKQWTVDELCEAVRSAFGVVTSDRCVYEAEFKETNEQMEAVINALRSIRPPDEPSVKNDHLSTALSILRDAAIEKGDALPPELAKALLDEIERLRFTAEPTVCPWCGSREQHTDPRGTCARCKIPWRREDFLTGVDDERLRELRQSVKRPDEPSAALLSNMDAERLLHLVCEEYGKTRDEALAWVRNESQWKGTETRNLLHDDDQSSRTPTLSAWEKQLLRDSDTDLGEHLRNMSGLLDRINGTAEPSGGAECPKSPNGLHSLKQDTPHSVVYCEHCGPPVNRGDEQ